jgi:hypothetical protein
VLRSSEAYLLGKPDPEDHSGLAVVGKPLPGRSVDQRVQIGYSTQYLARYRDGERLVGRLKLARGLGGGIERSPAPQDGIEHLQRGSARGKALNAWH